MVSEMTQIPVSADLYIEMLTVIQNLLQWVDGLPVKHPQQAKWRDRGHEIVERVTGKDRVFGEPR